MPRTARRPWAERGASLADTASSTPPFKRSRVCSETRRRVSADATTGSARTPAACSAHDHSEKSRKR
eukprot:scaffold53_cov193-Pinguiococcus_pyrenoidosus.AAC.8